MKTISEANYRILKKNLGIVCQLAQPNAMTDSEKNKVRELKLINKKL